MGYIQTQKNINQTSFILLLIAKLQYIISNYNNETKSKKKQMKQQKNLEASWGPSRPSTSNHSLHTHGGSAVRRVQSASEGGSRPTKSYLVSLILFCKSCQFVLSTLLFPPNSKFRASLPSFHPNLLLRTPSSSPLPSPPPPFSSTSLTHLSQMLRSFLIFLNSMIKQLIFSLLFSPPFPFSPFLSSLTHLSR